MSSGGTPSDPDAVVGAFDGARPLRTLVRLYRRERRHLAIAAVAFAIKHSPVWITPLMTAIIIDVVVDHEPLSRLAWAAAVMVVIVAQNYPIGLLYVRRQSLAIRNVEASLRIALTRRLQELSIGYHRRTSAGVVQAKVIRDVESIVEASRQTLDTGLAALTTLAGALVLTAVRVPEFLAVYAIAVPAAAVLVVASRRRMRERNALFRNEMERMSVRVAEMAHLIPVTRAHASEEREAERVDAAVTGVRTAGLELDVVNGRFGAVSWIGFQLLSVACLVGAALLAWHDWWGIGAGDVVMLSAYFVQLTGAVTALVAIVPFLSRGLEAVRSVGEVLGADDLERNAGKPAIGPIAGAIEIDALTVAYPEVPDQPALDRVTLSVEPGETVALVGPSGSGKSTLLNAVIGFVAPTHGAIRVDGTDIAGLDMRSLRRQIAVVPQEALLFEGTVRDNVTYGSPAVADDAVVAALEGAQAWAFVRHMGGLDARIGERGARLSGGQRQRLTIARALVRDPRILILDEATSALDTESEVLVQRALATLMRGRTTLVVAHRLSTIRGADRIVVLEDGRIAEIGDHATLAQAGGPYARLHGRG